VVVVVVVPVLLSFCLVVVVAVAGSDGGHELSCDACGRNGVVTSWPWMPNTVHIYYITVNIYILSGVTVLRSILT
jgi:hypothetical protein